MDFRDVLSERPIVRHYDSALTPRETIERIVRTVRRGRSGDFSQGQRLVVFTDPQARRRVTALLHENEWVAGGRRPGLSVPPVHVVSIVPGVTISITKPDPNAAAAASIRLTQRRYDVEEVVRWERW